MSDIKFDQLITIKAEEIPNAEQKYYLIKTFGCKTINIFNATDRVIEVRSRFGADWFGYGYVIKPSHCMTTDIGKSFPVDCWFYINSDLNPKTGNVYLNLANHNKENIKKWKRSYNVDDWHLEDGIR